MEVFGSAGTMVTLTIANDGATPLLRVPVAPNLRAVPGALDLGALTGLAVPPQEAGESFEVGRVGGFRAPVDGPTLL